MNARKRCICLHQQVQAIWCWYPLLREQIWPRCTSDSPSATPASSHLQHRHRHLRSAATAVAVQATAGQPYCLLWPCLGWWILFMLPELSENQLCYTCAIHVNFKVVVRCERGFLCWICRYGSRPLLHGNSELSQNLMLCRAWLCCEQ